MHEEVFNLYEGTEGNSRCYQVISREEEINKLMSEKERVHRVERFFEYIKHDFERVNLIAKNSYSVFGSNLSRCFSSDLVLIIRHPENTKKILEDMYPDYKLELIKNNFDI